MRTVNMAHGAMFLFGGYIAYDVAEMTQSWFLGAGAEPAPSADYHWIVHCHGGPDVGVVGRVNLSV